jgi:hypothetical protein
MSSILFISEIERREREAIFLQNVNAKHGKMFDYNEVYYTNNVTKVTIICKIHGSFQQAPAKHLSHKYACPECAKIAQGLSVRIDRVSFLKQTTALYGNRHNYDNTKLGRKNETIQIYCNIHKHYFNQVLGSHLKGYIGCKECLREKKEEQAHEIFKQNFIEQFINKFGTGYDFSKVVYINNISPVLVKCKKHNHEFQQVHRNIKRSAVCSCPECKKEYRLSKKTII